MLASAVLFGTALDAPSLFAALLVGAGVALYSRPDRPAEVAYELVATVAPLDDEAAPGYAGKEDDSTRQRRVA